MRHAMTLMAVSILLGGCSRATSEEGAKGPGSPPNAEHQHVYMATTANGLDVGGLVVRLAPVPDVYTGSPTMVTLTPASDIDVNKGKPITLDHPAEFDTRPGSYHGTVHKRGFESQTFDIHLRKGYVDTLEVVLVPEKP
jgi:hypothetical protein